MHNSNDISQKLPIAPAKQKPLTSIHKNEKRRRRRRNGKGTSTGLF